MHWLAWALRQVAIISNQLIDLRVGSVHNHQSQAGKPLPAILRHGMSKPHLAEGIYIPALCPAKACAVLLSQEVCHKFKEKMSNLIQTCIQSCWCCLPEHISSYSSILHWSLLRSSAGMLLHPAWLYFKYANPVLALLFCFVFLSLTIFMCCFV